MSSGFVPDNFDATIWENIEPLTNDLIERELSCSSCIEGLISDSSELAEHISETGALLYIGCLLYTSPSPRDGLLSRMPSSA